MHAFNILPALITRILPCEALLLNNQHCFLSMKRFAADANPKDKGKGTLSQRA
jgi:hypothetical protein